MTTEKASQRRIVFLLGAGASIPAGMRTTQEITERVLSGESVYKWTDDSYRFGEHPHAKHGLPDKYVPRVVALLNAVKDDIDSSFHDLAFRPTTYEDLFYYVTQIDDNRTGEYENPALQPAFDRIVALLEPYTEKRSNGEPGWLNEARIIEESSKYLADVVWRLLVDRHASVDHLAFLIEPLKGDTFATVDLVTLNHDTVVESFLDREGIPFVDGFVKDDSGISYWQYEAIGNPSATTRLLKLHGSVDWFSIRTNNSGKNRIVKWGGGDIHHIPTNTGYLGWPEPGRPMLLIGTFNKILDYWGNVYSDLHCAFHAALRQTETLFVCGYGFGDKAVNTRIVLWMQESPRNRLIVAHKNKDSLLQSARPAIRDAAPSWIQGNRMLIIPKWIQELSWEDIAGLI